MSAHILIAGYYIFIAAIIPIQFIGVWVCGVPRKYSAFVQAKINAQRARALTTKLTMKLSPNDFFQWIVPGLLWNVEGKCKETKNQARCTGEKKVRNVSSMWNGNRHQPNIIYSRQTADKLCICGRIEFRTAAKTSNRTNFTNQRRWFQQWKLIISAAVSS